MKRCAVLLFSRLYLFSLVSFAQYVGLIAMSARSRMKIRSARLPAPILVLHQNLLREVTLTSDLSRLAVGYVRRYAPSRSRSNLRLTKNLRREKTSIAFSKEKKVAAKPTDEDALRLKQSRSRSNLPRR